MTSPAELSPKIAATLTKEKLQAIFPQERSNEFFEALFGDASEGAYDIELAYRSVEETAGGLRLIMELRLHQRPGCCLACNLTSGLPQVFSRHPIIDLDGVTAALGSLLEGVAVCGAWSVGGTEQVSDALHIVPLYITMG